jgi:hypothetical protein
MLESLDHLLCTVKYNHDNYVDLVLLLSKNLYLR